MRVLGGMAVTLGFPLPMSPENVLLGFLDPLSGFSDQIITLRCLTSRVYGLLKMEWGREWT